MNKNPCKTMAFQFYTLDDLNWFYDQAESAVARAKEQNDQHTLTYYENRIDDLEYLYHVLGYAGK